MARYLLINAGANNHGATQAVLETVLQAIPQGSQGELVCLGDCGIHYGRGCKACYETGRCVQRDGMDGLMERMDQADGIIFAVPSYWADIPGQCKVFIDRCTAYGDTNPRRLRLRPDKRCYAIALRAGRRPAECEHIIECIRHWCGHMGVTLAGSLYFCGIDGRADIEPHKGTIRKTAQAWLAEDSGRPVKEK